MSGRSGLAAELAAGLDGKPGSAKDVERQLFKSIEAASQLEGQCYALVGGAEHQDSGLARIAVLNVCAAAVVVLLYAIICRNAYPSFFCKRQRLPFKTWLASVWNAGFDELVMFCGKEAAFYIAFQRMLLCLTTCMMVISLPVTLPINLSGGRCSGFVATTASNLPLGPSVKLWGHAATAIAISIVTWFTTFHFERWFEEQRIVWNPAAIAGQFGDVARRSVMFKHVPREATADEIRETLENAYPGYVLNVQKTHHLRKLMDLTAEREELIKDLARLNASAAARPSQHRQSVVAVSMTTNERPEQFRAASMLQSVAGPVRSGVVMIDSPHDLWAKIVEEVDEAERACAPCLAPLSRRIDNLQRKLVECEAAIGEEQRSPTGYPNRVVFATFRASKIARDCIRDTHAATGWRLIVARCFRTRVSEPVQALMAGRWWGVGVDARPAPDPSDIKWQNLRVTSLEFRVRTVAVFLVILLIVFFWNVPLAFIAEVNNLARVPVIGNLLDAAPWLRRSLSQYWPSLMLLLFNTALPSIVYGLVQLQGYMTYSSEYRAACSTIFAFFFLNLIIFPSALKSLLKFAEFVTEQMMEQEALDLSVGLTLSRVLGTVLGSSGSFFVAYVLQAACVRNCVDLLVIPQVIVTSLRRWRARTPLEREEAREVPPFDFHVGYAEVAILFAVAIMFSSTVPIILPAAGLFFLFRYFVDKGNIMYVHKPYTATDGELVPGALEFVHWATVLWQFAIAGYLTARSRQFAFLALLPFITLAVRFSRFLRTRNWPAARFIRRIMQCYPLQPATSLPSGPPEPAPSAPPTEGGSRNSTPVGDSPSKRAGTPGGTPISERDSAGLLRNDALAARAEGMSDSPTPARQEGTPSPSGGGPRGAKRLWRRPMLANIPRTMSMVMSVPTLDAAAYMHPALSIAQIAAQAAAVAAGSFGRMIRFPRNSQRRPPPLDEGQTFSPAASVDSADPSNGSAASSPAGPSTPAATFQPPTPGAHVTFRPALQASASFRRSRAIAASHLLSPYGPEFPPVQAPEAPSMEAPVPLAEELAGGLERASREIAATTAELAASTAELASTTAQSVRRIVLAAGEAAGSLFTAPSAGVAAETVPDLSASLGSGSGPQPEDAALKDALAWASEGRPASPSRGTSPAPPSPPKAAQKDAEGPPPPARAGPETAPAPAPAPPALPTEVAAPPSS